MLSYRPSPLPKPIRTGVYKVSSSIWRPSLRRKGIIASRKPWCHSQSLRRGPKVFYVASAFWYPGWGLARPWIISPLVREHPFAPETRTPRNLAGVRFHDFSFTD